MGMQHGISGLNAASKGLDVIGNNIANANTVGFKSAQARFASVFASAGGKSDAGLGVTVAGVATSYAQGGLLSTGNPLDLAISGKGFFITKEQGANVYTRNGQMQIDKDGYLTDISGSRFQGYALDINNEVDTTRLTDLQLRFDELEPTATAAATLKLNLNSDVALKPTAAFNMADPSTYNNATSLMVYDSLGQAHVSTSYFLKTGVNQYEVMAAVDGALIGNVGTLRFNNDGTMDPLTSTIPMTVSYANNSGAVNPSAFTLDMASTTQFGSDFSVNDLSQDGNPPSRLVDFSINAAGEIYGKYSNGDNRIMGQMAVATFRSEQGLKPIDQTKFVDTGDSGQPNVGVPGTSGSGELTSGVVEDSNVDMTQQLVSMMTMQRLYQANTQTIKTQDQISQTLMNLR